MKNFKKKEVKKPFTYEKIFFKKEWIKKELGTIEDGYVLISIGDFGETILEYWKLK